jgi:hypothetical protein
MHEETLTVQLAGGWLGLVVAMRLVVMVDYSPEVLDQLKGWLGPADHSWVVVKNQSPGLVVELGQVGVVLAPLYLPVIDLSWVPGAEVCSQVSSQLLSELDHRLFSEVLVALQTEALYVAYAVMVTLLTLQVCIPPVLVALALRLPVVLPLLVRLSWHLALDELS